ncbi:MAG: hypothetical protein ACRCV3_01070 [Desulfovibrionaceae bacterium]
MQTERKERYAIVKSLLENNELSLTPISQALLQLLTFSMQTWSKKNTTLLAMQCGSGIFLHTLLQNAFTVHIIEPLKEVRAKLEDKDTFVHIYGHSLTHVNADNNSFDYTVILYPSFYINNITDIISEAIRVTSRSILLLNLNLFSLDYLLSYSRKDIYYNLSWKNPYTLYKKISSLYPNTSLSFTSIGNLPLLHKKKTLFSPIVNPFPFATLMAFRIDIPPYTSYTPLLLPIKEFPSPVYKISAIEE